MRVCQYLLPTRYTPFQRQRAVLAQYAGDRTILGALNVSHASRRLRAAQSQNRCLPPQVLHVQAALWEPILLRDVEADARVRRQLRQPNLLRLFDNDLQVRYLPLACRRRCNRIDLR